jgi:hypothetical protein
MRYVMLIAVLGLVGCGEPMDPGSDPVFANVQFVIACADGTCAQAVDLCGNVGEPCDGVPGVAAPAAVTCSAVPTGDVVRLSFEAGGADTLLTVSDAIVSAAGGRASGTSCGVGAIESADADALEGACGDDLSGDVPPCAITNVQFFDDEGRPGVQGEIECSELRSSDGRVRVLDGGPSDIGTLPGQFTFIPCGEP